MEIVAAGGAGLSTGRSWSCAPRCRVWRREVRGSFRRRPGASAPARPWRRDRSSAPTDGLAGHRTRGSIGNGIASQCRPRSRHTRRSGSAAALRSPARTASRSDADDSPSPGRRRHMTGNPVVERHGPWPGQRRPLAGRLPAAAWLRSGSNRDCRSPRDHQAARSPSHRCTGPAHQLPPLPTAKSKPPATPRRENSGLNYGV